MKAVIMAGGEGSRLRPLTSGLPKPLVPILGKPVMAYGLQLLKHYGVVDIGATLCFLPQKIEQEFGDGEEYGVNLAYFREDKPLGTAGSIKNAEGFLNEPFIVLSGDALTDIDLGAVMAFHREKGALVTLVTVRRERPLEYGVIVSDENGRVRRYLEKPHWGQVFSDQVNTGIYVMEREVLGLIPRDQKFDFSNDLFPLLLERRLPFYAYPAKGYWCDIGNVQQYMQAQRDFLKGEVFLKMPIAAREDGFYIHPRAAVHPEAELTAPCFIGAGTVVEGGAKVGAYTVLGKGCLVASGARLERSVLWDGVCLGEESCVEGAALCGGVRVGEGAQVEQGSVLGENVRVERGARVRPSAMIWPEKLIEAESEARGNLIWGQNSRGLFQNECIALKRDDYLSPAFLAALGEAAGAFYGAGVVGVSALGSAVVDMARQALVAGLQSQGIRVMDLLCEPGEVLGHAVREFNWQGGVFLFERAGQVYVRMLDTWGQALSPAQERKVENLWQRGEYPVKTGGIVPVETHRNGADRYLEDMLKSLPHGNFSKNFKVWISCEHETLEKYAAQCLRALGCTVRIRPMGEDGAPMERCDLGFIWKVYGSAWLDGKGRRVSADAVQGLLLDAWCEEHPGETVVLAPDMPHGLSEIVRRHGGEAVRCKSGQSERRRAVFRAVTREKAAWSQVNLLEDPLMATLWLLAAMDRRRISLEGLAAELPTLCRCEREIQCPVGAKGRVMRSLLDQNRDSLEEEQIEGVRLRTDRGWAWVQPDRVRPVFHVYGEAADMEAAEELTDFYVRQIDGMLQ